MSYSSLLGDSFGCVSPPLCTAIGKKHIVPGTAGWCCVLPRGTGRGAETPNELFGLCKIRAGSVSSMFIPLSLPPPQGPTIELSISFGHVELHFSQSHLTVLIVQDLQTTSPFLPTCHPCRVLFGDRPSTSASTNTQTEHLHLCVPWLWWCFWLTVWSDLPHYTNWSETSSSQMLCLMALLN